ncbi:MAG: glycoside hydrolase family 127 protein [Verrucomicrobiia bacterium]
MSYIKSRWSLMFIAVIAFATIGFEKIDLFTAEGAIPPAEITRSERKPVPFVNVTITDNFWSPKQKVYRERTIPHSWQYVQKEIEDNEIAAGWKNIPRGKDTPWNQANLHKVLETCAYSLGQENNPALNDKVDYIISAISAAQQPNGYVNALITVRKMTPWANLDGQHDGYVAGHLIEAAVAHYLCTGKTNFLNIARKLADHIYNYFIIENHEGVCGHSELELALVRLYRVTGEKRYLDLSLNWIERRGKPWKYSSTTPRSYFMDHLPARQLNEITGHAVRAIFYATGIADTAIETNDEGLKETARRLFASATKKKMYITGGVGSQKEDEGFGPDYFLPNRNGYAESCAACGLVNFAFSMFRMDGNSSSIDILERTLYNALLHGISLDGTNSYYTNPLTDENHLRDNCWVCCPPNISRTLLRFQEYIYAYSYDSIYVNLYIGSKARINIKNNSVVVTQTTEYPWNGKVNLVFSPEREGEFTVKFRIPDWTRSFSLKLNGDLLKETRRSDGYVWISRKWKKQGDRVEIEFPMPVERIAAHPEVKNNEGRVAIQRGPLVYGFESIDNQGEVSNITLAKEPGFEVSFRENLLNGVAVVIGKKSDGGNCFAIPFYALANRGRSKQTVWVQQQGFSRPADGWKENLYQRVAD